MLLGIMLRVADDEFNVVDVDSHLVTAGDTLWNIATENTPENEDVREYMNLMKINM